MTTMIAEVYDALKEAGASEDKAKAAAEVLAGFGRSEEHFGQLAVRLDGLEQRMGRLEGRMDRLENGQQDITVRLVRVETSLQLLVRLQYGLLFAISIVLLRLFLFWPAG